MTTDLTVGHPRKTLWRFLLPMLVSVMFQQFYNIADSMIAGRFAGENALAAVGASYPITVIFMAFATGHTHSVYLLCGPEHSPDCLRHHFLWAHDEMDQNTG